MTLLGLLIIVFAVLLFIRAAAQPPHQNSPSIEPRLTKDALHTCAQVAAKHLREIV